MAEGKLAISALLQSLAQAHANVGTVHGFVQGLGQCAKQLREQAKADMAQAATLNSSYWTRGKAASFKHGAERLELVAEQLERAAEGRSVEQKQHEQAAKALMISAGAEIKRKGLAGWLRRRR